MKFGNEIMTSFLCVINVIAHGQNLPVQILIRGKRVRGASGGSVVYMRSQIQKI